MGVPPTICNPVISVAKDIQPHDYQHPLVPGPLTQSGAGEHFFFPDLSDAVWLLGRNFHIIQ